jgi:hypothetical protein
MKMYINSVLMDMNRIVSKMSIPRKYSKQTAVDLQKINHWKKDLIEFRIETRIQ